MLLWHTRCWKDNHEVNHLPSSPIDTGTALLANIRPTSSSIVIQHLINLQYKVAFLYCDYRDEKDQTLLNILGHLLEQLLAATSKVPDAIITLLDDIQRAGKSLTISDISQILRLAMMTPNPSRLFICIDALDELLPRVRLDLLKALQSEFGSAQIFLTGRNQIESEVQSICQVREHDAIDIIANSDDIRQYLTREIEKDAEANPDDMNDKLSEEILEAITNRAQGMYVLQQLPHPLFRAVKTHLETSNIYGDTN